MYNKFICVVFLILVVFQSSYGRRIRKNKLANTETEKSTPQPSVLTYSTFGFNDVGSYDGFVPSSPDYANYLTSNHQDSSSRLYAPAFPSNLDSNFASNYDAQAAEQQMGVNNFQPVQMDFFTSPSSDFKDENKNFETEDRYKPITDDFPAYGDKLNSKSKSKLQVYNSSRYNEFGNNAPITGSESTIEKNHFSHDAQEPTQMKFVDYRESNKMNSNNLNYPHNFEVEENDKILKIPSNVSPNPIKFSKVIDFTHLKENYPTSVNNEYLENVQQTLLNPLTNGNEDRHVLSDSYKAMSSDKAKHNFNTEKYQRERKSPKINSFQSQDSADNTINIGNNVKSSIFDQEHKDNTKSRPWLYSNYIDDSKKSAMKGYQYSTNHSSTSFKYNYGPPKKQFNSSVDEIAPASSNQGFTSYQLPEKDFTESSNIASFKHPYESDNNNIYPFANQNKPFEENQYELQTTYTTLPTVSSHWGNIFKTTEYTQHKNHVWKPNIEDNRDDIVHIPKRPLNQKYINHINENANDWTLSNNNHRPYLLSKPQNEWSENVKTRFKSEEDLLGLRTHESSRPNYFPNYKPIYNDFAEEFDYKKLVEKWRQNYIKSKQRDSYRDYEPYSSDQKPIHVPMPRPYHIEVPHPVIVPVPEPYPVKVPMPKPVAVPVIQEVTVPIEKPVPYPIYKKVPYPIVKPVPVPVVRQVPVPVVKPYPVAVPHIKPIFHHTKPHDDDEPEYDEEYSSRPDKKPKRPKITRNRPRSPALHPSRRPSRMTYHERNKKRLPTRPTFSSNDHRHARRPSFNREHYDSPPHRYREESEEDDYEPSEFYRYCKRTGKC